MRLTNTIVTHQSQIHLTSNIHVLLIIHTAEVLIASETGSREDSTVATIQSVDYTTGTLTFTAPITPLLTSTLEGPGGGPNFAVEVALLSRNVVFRTDDDLTPGHQVVSHTSNGEGHEQVLSGVKIVNFGQTGTLGKYVSVYWVFRYFCSICMIYEYIRSYTIRSLLTCFCICIPSFYFSYRH